VIFDLVILALAITFEPIPLTAFIVVLASERGVRKGAGFIFGWLASLAAVIALTLLATGNNPPKPSTGPSIAALVVKLVIGLVLVAIGIRQWRRRNQPKKEKPPPKWQSSVDNMSPWFAMALGVLVQPWGLVAAGVATVMEAKLSSWESYAVLFGFCVLASITYIALELYAAFRPTQTQALLTRIRAWIAAHTDQVIVILALAVGFLLIAKSLYALLS